VNDSRAPFFRRAHRIALAVAAASLLFGTVWLVFAEDFDFVRSNDADGYSESALGHKALLELLADRGIEAHQSRFRSAARPREGDVLLLVEPREPPDWGGDAESERGDPGRSFAAAHRVLLVLPRWRPSTEDEFAPMRWVRATEEESLDEVRRCVSELLPDVEVVRAAATQEWTEDLLGVEPSLGPPQLVRSSRLRTLVGCAEGTLVGELDDGERRVVVVSDPTPFQNHGIWRGDNASLALSAIDALRAADGVVVVDETLHGFEAAFSPLRELFRRPLLWTTLHLLALLGLVAWAACSRFGRPLAEPPGLRAGKQALLDNVAELLDVIGAGGFALRRYLDAALDRVLVARHAPDGISRTQQLEWLLARLPPDQGRALAELDAAVEEARARRRGRRLDLALAQRIHRLRSELVDGP
jgi:hypothetical protein